MRSKLSCTFSSLCNIVVGDIKIVKSISTMGIFPIIMNIIQFWLIDSIVKASSAISLDSASSDPNDDEHQQPLFGASSDDEDEEAYKPGDIENQRRNRYSPCIKSRLASE